MLDEGAEATRIVPVGEERSAGGQSHAHAGRQPRAGGAPHHHGTDGVGDLLPGPAADVDLLEGEEALVDHDHHAVVPFDGPDAVHS